MVEELKKKKKFLESELTTVLKSHVITSSKCIKNIAFTEDVGSKHNH